jgi:predicted 2-oxoglutarate/Fe(II)-dependent dioxygenase YbiX
MSAAPAGCVELRAVDVASGLLGVFATSRVTQGDTAFVEDAHAVVQVTPSDAAVACAYCLRPLDDTPSAEGQRRPVECTWRCGAQFCCQECRDAACRDSHGCLCPCREVEGDPGEFSPLRQWAHQAGTVNALFLLCGSLLGSALTRAAAPEALRREFARLRETYGCRGADQPWWEIASGCTAGSDAAQRRLRRALRDQAEESFTLLQAGLCSNRQPHRDAFIREELTLDLYARLLGALHLCVQPVTAPSPLARRCERLHLPREQLVAALAELRPIAEAATQRGRPRRRPKAGGASCAPLVAAGACEFKVSSLWEPEPAAAPAPVPAIAVPVSLPAPHESDAIDWDDAPERVAAQLSDLAPRLFQGVSGLAVAPLCAAVNHSCLPNVQVEATWSEHRMRLAAIALRDIEPGEELRCAYVATSAGVSDRRDALAAAGHRFICSCPRCVLDVTPAGERDTAMASMAVRELHALAKQAQERGDYEEAQALLQAILRSSTPDAEAHHALGVCLLAQGDWTGAHAVWASAYQRWPQSPTLRAQAMKDASYWPAKDAPIADGSALQSEAAVRHIIPGVACMSATQLMGAADCAAAIAAAEAAAAGGGWTTQRHYAVPTTDVPVHTVPPVLALFNKALQQRIAPFVAAAFPDMVPSPDRLRIHDAFLVKYDATHDGHQRFLPVHEDESELSLTVALNPRRDYAGGGTFFEAAHDAAKQVVCPDQGQVLAFRGSRRHGGEPITEGVRYIFAVFAWVQRS